VVLGTHLVDLAIVPVVGEEVEGAGCAGVCEEFVKDCFEIGTAPDCVGCPCG
jgi:hypothetical protein